MKPTVHRYQAAKNILRTIQRGHPWVYTGALSSAIEPIPAGSVVRIVDGRNRFVTHAIYEPHGLVGLRTFRANDPFSLAHYCGTISNLLENKRKSHKGARGAFRLLNGEADNFPGLACDVYGDLCVWQPYLAFWDEIIPLLAREVERAGWWKRHLLKYPSHREGVEGVVALAGELPKEPVLFEENGVRLGAFPVTGQKSGFFLDLKHARTLLPEIVRGKKVLNCFANSGAFTAIAMLHGAERVVSVDEAEQCRDQLSSILEANRLRLNPRDWITADIWSDFNQIATESDEYDLIILDPPNMCTKKSSVAPALKGWRKLLSRANGVLAENGRIMAINCSPFMTREMCEREFEKETVQFMPEAFRGLPPDHTTARHFPEGYYLKIWLLTRKQQQTGV